MDGLCVDINELLHYFLCIKKPNNDKDFIVPKKGLLDDYYIIETYMYDQEKKNKKND